MLGRPVVDPVKRAPADPEVMQRLHAAPDINPRVAAVAVRDIQRSRLPTALR